MPDVLARLRDLVPGLAVDEPSSSGWMRIDTRSLTQDALAGVRHAIGVTHEYTTSHNYISARPWPEGQRGALTGPEIDAIKADATALVAHLDVNVWFDLGCIYVDPRNPADMDRVGEILRGREDWHVDKMEDGYAVVLKGCQIYGI